MNSVTDWNERYRRDEQMIREPLPLLARAVETLAPGRALDLACGAGRHAIFLAERGWQVTAVDSSPVAIELTATRAFERGVSVNALVANLERGEFVIPSETYDLICVCYYLQRDLFPQIRAGVRVGGTVIAVIHMVDDAPDLKPMSPAFLLHPGELSAEFRGWEILHNYEGRATETGHKRASAEIVARRISQSTLWTLAIERGAFTPFTDSTRGRVNEYGKRKERNRREGERGKGR